MRSGGANRGEKDVSSQRVVLKYNVGFWVLITCSYLFKRAGVVSLIQIFKCYLFYFHSTHY